MAYYRFLTAQLAPKLRQILNDPQTLETEVFNLLSVESDSLVDEERFANLQQAASKFQNLECITRFQPPGPGDIDYLNYGTWCIDKFGVVFDRGVSLIQFHDTIVMYRLRVTSFPTPSLERFKGADWATGQSNVAKELPPLSDAEDLELSLTSYRTKLTQYSSEGPGTCSRLQTFMGRLFASNQAIQRIQLDLEHVCNFEFCLLQCPIHSLVLQWDWNRLRRMELTHIKVREDRLCTFLSDSNKRKLRVMQLSNLELYVNRSDESSEKADSSVIRLLWHLGQTACELDEFTLKDYLYSTLDNWYADWKWNANEESILSRVHDYVCGRTTFPFFIPGKLRGWLEIASSADFNEAVGAITAVPSDDDVHDSTSN